MKAGNAENANEIPISWFAFTLYRFVSVFIELIFLAFCIRVLELIQPFVFQVIIDRILPFQRESSLEVVALVFLLATSFQIGFGILSEYLGMRAANSITQELGVRIFRHLLRLPLRYFRNWHVGEIIARVNETGAIRSFLVGTTTGALLDLLFVSVYLIILLKLSLELSVVVLLGIPVQILIYVCFGPALRKRLRNQFDADAKLQSYLVEGISGIATVKALTAEDIIGVRLKGSLRYSLDTRFKVGLVSLAHDKLLFLVDRVVTISIIFLGAKLVFANAITLGELVAFHLIAEKVAGPIENFSRFWESWQNTRISRQRLGDVINSPTELFDALPKLPRESLGSLEFSNVHFSYDSSVSVLRDFNFRAAPNTLTLVIGPSGAGKSTFGRLASGIERPDEGAVYLGGCNIAHHEPRDVRAQIAYVPQEPFLFSGTLLENLTFGDAKPGDADFERALRILGAYGLLQELPMGLETQVGERGSALSGGQRQRIAIARAMMRKPKVIVLDEPTSALDVDTRSKVAAELQELSRESTVIVITHSPEAFDSPNQIVQFGSQL